MPGTAGGGELPPTKTIIVYRNGDAFFPGKRVVVNPRQVTTFENVLATLTSGIEAPFGAVRRLYTATEGYRVQRLDSLNHGSVYVAAGNEQFKKLNYCAITTKKPQNKKKDPIQPVLHSKIVVCARWGEIMDESRTIHVFTNGEVLVPPARIQIPKYTLTNWENVLTMVTEKVHLRTGAVHRLFTLDGRLICGSAELENNQHYVAVGAGKFRALPYDHSAPCRGFLQENNSLSRRDILPPIRTTTHKKDAFARTCFKEDLEHTARGQTKKHAAKLQRTKQQRQVSRNPVLFSTGEGSVFNAQNIRSEMAGAAEVKEDSRLKVDLPIDQVEAEMVDEENDELHPQRPLSADSCKDLGLSSGQRKSVKGSENIPVLDTKDYRHLNPIYTSM